MQALQRRRRVVSFIKSRRRSKAAANTPARHHRIASCRRRPSKRSKTPAISHLACAYHTHTTHVGRCLLGRIRTHARVLFLSLVLSTPASAVLCKLVREPSSSPPAKRRPTPSITDTVSGRGAPFLSLSGLDEQSHPLCAAWEGTGTDRVTGRAASVPRARCTRHCFFPLTSFRLYEYPHFLEGGGSVHDPCNFPFPSWTRALVQHSPWPDIPNKPQ